MVEAGANEIPEAEILDALDIAHAEIKKLCALQRDLAAKVGKEKKVFETIQVDPAVLDAIRASHGAAARRGDAGRGQARAPGRHQGGRGGDPRAARPGRARGCLRGAARRGQAARAAVQMAFDKLEKSIIRERIAVHKKRPDGRGEARSATSRSRSASRRARTARRCSRVGRRRR